MEKVILTHFVRNKLSELIETLYDLKYFGFYTDAENYVYAIFNFIQLIPFQRRYETINPKFGKYYCRYRPNRNTTYFITFDMEDDTYLIKNIITNHTREYPEFIMN